VPGARESATPGLACVVDD